LNALKTPIDRNRDSWLSFSCRSQSLPPLRTRRGDKQESFDMENISPQTPASAPAFAPLVPACAAHGISRTVAFELSAAGLLDTFLIGKRRYVYMDSLRTLPERLKAEGGAK